MMIVSFKSFRHACVVGCLSNRLLNGTEGSAVGVEVGSNVGATVEVEIAQIRSTGMRYTCNTASKKMFLKQCLKLKNAFLAVKRTFATTKN